VKAQASVIVKQDADSQQTANALSSQLSRLLTDESARARMSAAMSGLARPAAAADVATLILNLVGTTEIVARASEPVGETTASETRSTESVTNAR
jgi:DNA-binding TFAR19-related protein (PDSD5 family)